MQYNDGKIYDDFYNHSEEEKQLIAHDFSEGNEILEQALLNLWNRGIKTFGCCNGHSERNKHDSYIAIKADEKSTYIISQLINLVKNEGIPDIDIDFYRRDLENIAANITTTDKTKDFIFNKIIELSKSNEIYDGNNEYVENAKYLSKFAVDQNINFRYSIDNNQDKIGFYNTGSIVIFNDESEELEESLNEIRETGNIKSGVYKCNNQSLNELLKMIFPNEKKLNKNEEIKNKR